MKKTFLLFFVAMVALTGISIFSINKAKVETVIVNAPPATVNPAGIQEFGTSDYIPEIGRIPLMPTSTNAVRIPRTLHEGNSTTTESGTDGGTIQQTVRIDKARDKYLNINMVGERSTSTVYVKIQTSFDGNSWYDPATSTRPFVQSDATATTSVTVNPYAFKFPNIGLSTTSASVPLYTMPGNFMRVMFYGGDDFGAADVDEANRAQVYAELIDAQ